MDLGIEMVKRIKSLGLIFGEELVCLLFYVRKRLRKYDPYVILCSECSSKLGLNLNGSD